MDRTLSEMPYTEGSITSGKCTGCGQLFTTSAVALAGNENREWELVAAFGRHECTTAPLKSVL